MKFKDFLKNKLFAIRFNFICYYNNRNTTKYIQIWNICKDIYIFNNHFNLCPAE